MRRSIAALAVTGSLVGGGAVGALVFPPAVAGAHDETTEQRDDGRPGWVRGALDGLVEDGTITAGQADAVARALADARPHHGRHRHAAGRHLAAAAEAIGITTDELRVALREGGTLAAVAEANGVDPGAVSEALEADLRGHLDERVAVGRLTRERADEIAAEAAERLPQLVEGGVPLHRRRAPGHPVGDGT